VFRILVNTARSRGARDSRLVPVASFAHDADHGGPTVPADRFEPAGDPWAGHWVDGEPRPWRGDPSQGVLRAETRRLLEEALRDLPSRQRAVVVLRDVEGFEAPEVCEMLGLTEQNQRVLLHRGRAKVRAALETYYLEQETSG
jgi:RNA polymerase sigma-70 factor (ECF subfamily)